MGEPNPPSRRLQWCMVWLPTSKISGCWATMASTAWPVGVWLMAPVGNSVVHTWWSSRKFMMSSAGSSRPPMSKVRAMAMPVSGTRAMISGSPAATRLLAEQPLATGVGPGVGSGVGSTVGDGLALGSSEALTDAVALPDGDGDGEPWQAVTTRMATRRRAAGRGRPSGIGLLIGVVLEPAHGGQ